MITNLIKRLSKKEKGKPSSASEEEEIQISGPTNFQKGVHVSAADDGKTKLEGVPDAWKEGIAQHYEVKKVISTASLPTALKPVAPQPVQSMGWLMLVAFVIILRNTEKPARRADSDSEEEIVIGAPIQGTFKHDIHVDFSSDTGFRVCPSS